MNLWVGRIEMPWWSEHFFSPSNVALLLWMRRSRYGDGECLSPKDENVVVEKLLAFHPRAQDKIGCGLDAIMVSEPNLLFGVLTCYSPVQGGQLQCIVFCISRPGLVLAEFVKDISSSHRLVEMLSLFTLIRVRFVRGGITA
jgi:hypothetical protein